jgi:hypothetical protein
MSQRLLSALYNENNGTNGYDFVLWHFKKRLVKRVCTVGPLRFKMESAMSDHHDFVFWHPKKFNSESHIVCSVSSAFHHKNFQSSWS